MAKRRSSKSPSMKKTKGKEVTDSASKGNATKKNRRRKASGSRGGSGSDESMLFLIGGGVVFFIIVVVVFASSGGDKKETSKYMNAQGEAISEEEYVAIKLRNLEKPQVKIITKQKEEHRSPPQSKTIEKERKQDQSKPEKKIEPTESTEEVHTIAANEAPVEKGPLPGWMRIKQGARDVSDDDSTDELNNEKTPIETETTDEKKELPKETVREKETVVEKKKVVVQKPVPIRTTPKTKAELISELHNAEGWP